MPEDEKHNFQKNYWLDRICIAFGGRVAEEIEFDEITTGAESDIRAATKIARKMVCDWGMSERLGPLAYGKKDDAVFLGKDFGHQRDYSDSTADLIDDEVRRIIDEQIEKCRKLLTDNKEKLDLIAIELLERETLDANDIEKILAGESLDPLPPSDETRSSKEGVAADESGSGEDKADKSLDKVPGQVKFCMTFDGFDWQQFLTIVDILIVAFIIYKALLLVRGTRAQPMLLGLSIVLLVYLVSKSG